MKTKILLLLLLFHSAANAQNGEKAVSHTFYLTGNGGTPGGDAAALAALGAKLGDAGGNSTVLFLGNNAGPKGFIPTDSMAMARLDAQLTAVGGFAGRVVFLPGHLDWAQGLKAIQQQQRYINSQLSTDRAFLPNDGCGIKKIKVNAECDLILIDSQWAIMDWDAIPELNRDCAIRSKEGFYTEIEQEIVKSEGKIILIALHHPVASYGRFGNSYSFGIDSREIANSYYMELSDKLMTTALRFRNIVFVSGHEANLQYIVRQEIPIIISGAAREADQPKMGRDAKFVSGRTGFAKITVFTDSAVDVSYYDASNNFASPVYTGTVFEARKQGPVTDFKEDTTPAYVYRSIYSPEELRHSGVYKTLFGNHYRKDYITPVKIPAALLDTLYGGLSPIRRGGGHQTVSLRLADKGQRQYTLRGVRKSALRFAQYFVFNTGYLTPDAADTYFLELLQDYWTTANPYASLTIAPMSDAIGLYHTNPKLYYVPKQKALGSYNADFGDSVYLLEEQVGEGWSGPTSFGSSAKNISTEDLIDNLAQKGAVTINESLYIRTRLFDNIIGDFDRHHDQWRWAEQKKADGSLHYSPIPRDRDQAFADFDGFMIGAITTLNPPLRFMQRYSPTYRHLRWFNDAGDDVDRIALRNDTEEDWIREAQYIKAQLTPEIVERSFGRLPQGLDMDKQEAIKKALLARIAAVQNQASALYRYIKSRPVLTGSASDDHFTITRKPRGITTIQCYRMEEGKRGEVLWAIDFDRAVTKEIWIYGLDGKDTFETAGQGDHTIPIRIIGGQGHDTYSIKAPKGIRVYDHKSMPNTFEPAAKKTLSDSYQLNTYNFMNGRRDLSRILPAIGYNPDGGVGIGLGYSYTVNGLRRNPFTSKHIIKAKYFTATSGVAVDYDGEFANLAGQVNLGVKAGFTTPDYTFNFFGYGNATPDYDEFDPDYNRVSQRAAYLAPSLIYRSYYGSSVAFTLEYRRSDIEKTQGTFIATAPVSQKVFEGQDFYSAELAYLYANFDNQALPGKGISFGCRVGYTANFAEKRGFAYLVPELRVTTKIDPSGMLVYATKLKARHNLNDQFEFFQAASIGDGEGLRGFRQQRFSGRTSYYQNSDLRLNLGRLPNGFIPMTFGLYAGFDYGRVWVDNESSNTWHTSQGGGLFFNLAGFTTANIAYFNSSDGNRLNIGLQLAF